MTREEIEMAKLRAKLDGLLGTKTAIPEISQSTTSQPESTTSSLVTQPTQEMDGPRIVSVGCRDSELPVGGRLWRIVARSSLRQGGKVPAGWSARYGRRHNREFMDGATGDMHESRRKAVDWLWSQHELYDGQTGGDPALTRWSAEKVRDRARVLMQRVNVFRNMTPEELKDEGGDVFDLVDNAIMELFDLD